MPSGTARSDSGEDSQDEKWQQPQRSSEDGPSSSDSSNTSSRDGSGSNRGSDASGSESSSGERGEQSHFCHSKVTFASRIHEAKSLLPPAPTPEAQREFAIALHKPNGP
jgi:hypothetical protein